MSIGSTARKLNAEKAPSLDSFDEYVAAHKALAAVATRYDEVMAEMGKLGMLTRGASVFSSNPRRAVIEADLQDREISLRAELVAATETFNTVAEDCAHRIFEAAEPEHKRLLGEIVDLVVALSDALDAEADFRTDLAARGGQLGIARVVPLKIRNAIGSRRSWSSNVNDCGRLLSVYLDRGPWDHRPVVR